MTETYWQVQSPIGSWPSEMLMVRLLGATFKKQIHQFKYTLSKTANPAATPPSFDEETFVRIK